MYCRYCGNKLDDEDKVCPKCGKPVEEANVKEEPKENKIKFEEEELFPQENIYDKNKYDKEPTFEKFQSEVPEDKGSIGFGFLGFFFPIVGIILFFVWKKDKPVSARHVGIGTLIGFILWIVIVIPIICCCASMDWDQIIRDIENNQNLLYHFYE